MGYEVVDLKAQKAYVNMAVDNAKVFESVECWDLVQQADVIISVPKLKTHDQTEMTCAIKKLKGLLTDKAKKRHAPAGAFRRRDRSAVSGETQAGRGGCHRLPGGGGSGFRQTGGNGSDFSR